VTAVFALILFSCSESKFSVSIYCEEKRDHRVFEKDFRPLLLRLVQLLTFVPTVSLLFFIRCCEFGGVFHGDTSARGETSKMLFESEINGFVIVKILLVGFLHVVFYFDEQAAYNNFLDISNAWCFG
jgi:hypothetical protein